MNCATQQTASSHREPGSGRSPAGAPRAPWGCGGFDAHCGAMAGCDWRVRRLVGWAPEPSSDDGSPAHEKNATDRHANAPGRPRDHLRGRGLRRKMRAPLLDEQVHHDAEHDANRPTTPTHDHARVDSTRPALPRRPRSGARRRSCRPSSGWSCRARGRRRPAPAPRRRRSCAGRVVELSKPLERDRRLWPQRLRGGAREHAPGGDAGGAVPAGVHDRLFAGVVEAREHGGRGQRAARSTGSERRGRRTCRTACARRTAAMPSGAYSLIAGTPAVAQHALPFGKRLHVALAGGEQRRVGVGVGEHQPRVFVLRCRGRSAARATRGGSAGSTPSSKNVSSPSGSIRPSCCQAILVPGPHLERAVGAAQAPEDPAAAALEQVARPGAARRDQHVAVGLGVDRVEVEVIPGRRVRRALPTSDSSAATWSRLCHSQRTRPVLMSISWIAVSTIAPSRSPLADRRSQRIGL